MSKSLGNGVDPIEVIDEFGADALRFYIVTGNSAGNDMRYFPERCEAMRNFANKIWNASRFVMMNLDENSAQSADFATLPNELKPEDKWILSKLNSLTKEVTENLEKCELGIAAQKIYDFIWDSYCDWYIELTKPRLSSDDSTDSINAQKVLHYVLVEVLTILHPFMPFITEEIYQALPKATNQDSLSLLMVRQYTKFTDKLHFPKEEADFESIMTAIRAVRTRRAEMNVPPSKKANLTIVTENTDLFELGRAYISRLSFASDVIITRDAPNDVSNLVTVVTNDARLYMPLAELVDLEAERERIHKEIAKVNADIEKITQKLSNKQFTEKAPKKVVNTERERLEKLQALLTNLNNSLV